MSSERRIRASRANGAKSRGPKTPESKARSAASNLKHGLLAGTIVLDGENLRALGDLAASYERDFAPQNEVERALVQDMANARWRLMRLWATERATLQAEIEKHDPTAQDPAIRVALSFRALADDSRRLHLLNRYEARFERKYFRSLNLLLDTREASRPEAPDPKPFLPTNLVPKTDTNPPAPNQPTDAALSAAPAPLDHWLSQDLNPPLAVRAAFRAPANSR